jgi:hypothetical protein
MQAKRKQKKKGALRDGAKEKQHGFMSGKKSC